MTKLEILRQHMKEHGISAVVIPTADAHLSEYISDYYKFREYISGFTGSAGTLVVTADEAGLWTDGRYYIQAEKELSGSGIVLYKASEKDCIKIPDFLKAKLTGNGTVGLDGRLFSKKYLEGFFLKLNGIRVNTDYNPSEIWENRPPMPMGKAFILDEKYSGESTNSKISRVRSSMKKECVSHYLVSDPECIMWLLNIRGNDVENTPLILSYLLMTQNSVTFYAHRQKLTDEVTQYLKLHNIQVADYACIYEDVALLGEKDCLGADFSLTNYSLVNKIGSAKKNIKDIIYNFKCIKNAVELENIKKAYIKENIALAKAFYEIYNSDRIDECDVADIIEKYRKKDDNYIMPSFETIAAYGANAAMMHYGAEKGKCATIEKNGMLLIDTGGQYFEGTTDTTRTLVMGEITDEEKESLTLVLKSHIAMATAVFPIGTKCSDIDAIARMPLWRKGLDYRCSTGHGVGYLSGVHEGPQRLSVACREKLACGMTLTDEPGIYTENKYGIRTENHLCVKEAFKTEYSDFLYFEVLNYCPIGTEGLLIEMLDKNERKWINDYNTNCRELILPHLTKEESKWLTAYTKQL